MGVKISLQPKQREAIKSCDKYENVFFGGAKGGGKSHVVRAKELIRRLKYQGTHGVIIRKTYDELRVNHIQKFFTEYPETRAWYNKSEKTIHYPNGSTTAFKYLRRTEDVYNFQGLEFDDISLDEATQHEGIVVKTLASSLRTTNPNIKPNFFLTGNPGGIGHSFMKRLFIDRNFNQDETPENYHFIPAKVFDNEAIIKNDQAYLKRLEALPERLRRAYLDGDWNIFAGLAFEELDSIHIVKPFRLPDNTRFIAGYDYGYAHPFAWVLFAITPDKKVYVVDYLSMNKKRPDEQGKMIVEKIEEWELDHLYIYSGTDIWANKEGRSTIWEQLSKSVGKKASFIKAYTGRIDGVAEIRKVIAWRNTKTGEPQLRFFENTLDVYDQVRGMQIDEKKLEDVIKVNADDDGDGGDDKYDAFRYGVMARLYPNNKKPDTVKNNSGAELMRFVELHRNIAR
ncbi:MAG: phage terminase large subunit [Epsilonproteobacteria bacterium]|nr:phage terminase large subunit [Campylobacterota bacterium]